MKTKAGTIDRTLETAKIELWEERKKNTNLYHRLENQLRINTGLHQDLDAARESIKVLASSNAEFVKQRDYQDLRVGQLIDTIEHLAIAAGALGRRAMT